MQFRVPQNITMEDRIVGPLSPIQFGIVVVGGGISFVVSQAMWMPGILRNGLGGLLAFITVVLAVGKFNDQHMYKFIKFIWLFIVRPRTRIWHKDGQGEVSLIKPTRQKDIQRIAAPKQVSREDIAKLALVLDSRGSVGPPPKIANPEEEINKKK